MKKSILFSNEVRIFMKPYFKHEFDFNLSQDFINIENDNQRASREEMRESLSRRYRPPPACPNCCFSTISGNFFTNYMTQNANALSLGRLLMDDDSFSFLWRIFDDNLTLISTRIGTFSKQGDEYRTVNVWRCQFNTSFWQNYCDSFLQNIIDLL